MHLTKLTIVCCLLSACAGGVPQTQDPLEVLPPANLTQPPQALPQPKDGKVTTLEENHQAVTKQYHLLAAQLCELLRRSGIEWRECAPYYGDTNNK